MPMTNLAGHWSAALSLTTCSCFREILLVPLGLGYSAFNATTSVLSLRSTYTHNISRFCKISFKENQIFSSTLKYFQSRCNLILSSDLTRTVLFSLSSSFFFWKWVPAGKPGIRSPMGICCLLPGMYLPQAQAFLCSD